MIQTSQEFDRLGIDLPLGSDYTFVHMGKRNGPQLELLRKQPSAFGGSLMTTRKGRLGSRPLVTRTTMHLVLRSSKAKGDWSFRQPKHAAKITEIAKRFAAKYGVRILSLANVGNHLHFHIQLTNRFAYPPFIRAVTAAIAMAVTGACRVRPLKKVAKDRFWDYRPFTRAVSGLRELLNLRDYVQINKLEGQGFSRERARLFLVENEFLKRQFWSTG